MRMAAAAFAAILAGGAADPPAGLYKAIATVNGEIVTESDVDQRLALVTAANGGTVDETDRPRLRQQVLSHLIDETLEMQAAKSYGIEVTDDDVGRAYDRIAQNFGRSPEAFGTFLHESGSSTTSIRRQIRGEMAWYRLLSLRFKRDPSQPGSDSPVQAEPSQDPRDAILSLRQVTLSIAPDVPAAQASDRAARFAAAAGTIQSCDAAAHVAKSLGAAVADGQAVPIRNLPPLLQKALADLPVGRATAPYGTKDEMRVLVLCGRKPGPARGGDVGKTGNPGPDQDRARRYLRDLRQDAVIDYR